MKTIEILQNHLNEKLLIEDEDLMEKYSVDETPGEYHFRPDAVYLPESKDDIQELLKIANAEKVPVTPRGAGTSRCGGSLAVNGGVVVSLERMNGLLDIDRDNLILELEPGVITGEINRFLQEYNLFYPPDPASIDSCSIGGNVATNAGGARCLKYGVTRGYVMGFEFVNPMGEVDFFGGKFQKNVTGYSILNLIIGSEGTLGFITRILLKVLPRPAYSATILAPFDKIEDAANASFRVISEGYIPSSMEFIDEDSVSVTIEKGEKEFPFKNEKGSFLISEINEFTEREVEEKFEEIGERFLEYGANDVFIAEQSYQQDIIWDFRRGISEALDKVGRVIPEDVVVPRDKIVELVSFIKSIEDKYSTKIYTFGHIGDGNMHIDIIEKDNWRDGGKSLVIDIFKKVRSLGGKISGEHGIGYTKKRYLNFSRSEREINTMKRIKKIFDPSNIMNPGKIFD